MNEGKKDRRDPIRTVKPRNFVAKNASATTSGAGAHKDKKKAAKQGEVKHKKQEYAESLQAKLNVALAEEFTSPEYNDEAGMAYGSLHTLKRAVDGLMNTIDSHDDLPEWCQEKISLAEDYLVTVWDYLQSEKEQGIEPTVDEGSYRHGFADPTAPGLGRRGREDDEYHVPDPDPELQRNRQETMMYNVTVGGKPMTEKPFLGRGAALAWAKQQVNAGNLDPKEAKLSPVRYGQGVAEGLHPMIIDDVKKLATLSPTDRYSAYANIRDYFKADPALSKMASDLMGGYYEADMLRGKYKTDAAKAKYAELEPMHQAFVKQAIGQEQGVAEGDYPDGSSIKTPGADEWKQQYQQAVIAVKNAKTQQEYEAASDRASRIKDLLASKGIQVGPVLGQQGVAEGAKVDRQAMHITKSMMKAHPGMSKDDAEAAAWAHIKHPKKKKKAKEGWTHDTLADQLFEHERTYEDRLQNLLNKKLGK